jgi:hypothetical protein
MQYERAKVSGIIKKKNKISPTVGGNSKKLIRPSPMVKN